MTKLRLYLVGLITLLLFPIPTLLWSIFVNHSSLAELLQFDNIKLIPIAYGIEIGFCYAFLASTLLKAPLFERIPLPIETALNRLKINYLDALFLSICAGFGEELLFRSGFQPFLGHLGTAVFFVAVHGYFSFRKPLKSLYGLIVLPFACILGFGYTSFGLWFAISAHVMYDFVLFSELIQKRN
jgi:membrane protease YdiL (CAAX protease family)